MDELTDLMPRKKTSARYWHRELELAGDAERDWRKRAGAIVDLYRDDEKARGGKRFNILWANTETLRPALYARTAKPDVRRRFPDENPVARQTAMVIERGLSYCVDSYDLDRQMEATVQDMLLSGRGVAWLVYEVELAKETVQQVEMGPDGMPAIVDVEREYVAKQEVRTEHVPWEDFRISPCRKWNDRRWIARCHKLDKAELRREFPDHAEDIPLNWRPEDTERREEDKERHLAVVWEIWHGDSRERLWVADGYDEIMDRETDPYGLERFYPLPEPLYGVQPQDSLVPIPEYTLYQDQARELDEITARISKLVSALKRRGVYNKAIEGIERIADAGDNEFIGVADYTTLMEKGGLAGAFQTENLQGFADVLTGLYNQRQQVMQEIYELTGISELMRGVAEKGETATSARIRGSFGSLRMKERQGKVQRFVRDLYRLKAELIAEHFEPDILSQMTGLQVPDEVIQTMRKDRLRSYAVDIETDSTVFEDAEAEKQARVEFLGAMSQFVTAWLPVLQSVPEMAPLATEYMKFGARGFKIGRELEDVLDRTTQSITQRSAQPQQPDPRAQEAQARMEIEKQKLAMQGQKMQADMQARQAEAMSDAQLEAQKMRIDAELERRKQDQDMRIAARGQDMDAALARYKIDTTPPTETRQ